MLRTIWLDLGDLKYYMAWGRRPSGIQRLEYEICRALLQLSDVEDQIRCVAYETTDDTYRVIDWNELSQSFINISLLPPSEFPDLSETDEDEDEEPVPALTPSRIPPGIRLPAIDLGRHLVSAGQSVTEIARNIGFGILSRVKPRRDAAEEEVPVNPDPVWTPSPGDFLVSFGATWRSEQAKRVERIRDAYGVKYAMMFHDIIPLRRPEWFEPKLVRQFTAWAESILPLADVILANSNATRDDVARYGKTIGLDLTGRIHTLPVGTGFTKAEAEPAEGKEPERDLPAPGSYVLVVSTLEPRKNHALLFRVWRYLLDDVPAEQVPLLVFAGSAGWMTADLFQQLENANYLDGKIIFIERPTDAELETLYAGCKYTIYPSFYEGWGLPVTESFFHKRPCLASDKTSLPEAGGSLARYFDPDSGRELYRLVRNLIEKPGELRLWQKQVAAEFVPTPWSDTARSALRALHR